MPTQGISSSTPCLKAPLISFLSMQAAFYSYCGHSGPITDVCFLHDDRRVLSTGSDSTIIQWEVHIGL